MALLLFLASAAAALAAARRIFGAPSWPAGAALVALALVLPGFALVSGRVMAPLDAFYRFAPLDDLPAETQPAQRSAGILSDNQTQFLPWRSAVRHAFAAGEWPLWNPHSQGGDPLAGVAQPAPYFPSQLLSLLLPAPDGPAFVAAWTLLSAALAAFLLARGLGCREAAALTAAAGWALSSFLMFWLPWALAQTVALLPLVVLCTRRLVHAPRLASALALAGALALLLLTGHPESMLHVVAIGAVWGLTELAGRRPALPETARVVGAALGAGALALGLTAFFLLPFADVVLQSTEHHVRSTYLTAASKDLPLAEALRQLAASFIPFVHGVPGLELASGPERRWLPSSGYVASVLFFPALAGLFASRLPFRRLLAGLALFGLAAGAQIPPTLDLVGKLPLFSISLNERLVFLVSFALALLAAYGVESWLATDATASARPELRRRRAALALAPAAALAFGLALAWPALRASGLSAVFLAERSAWLLAPPLAFALLLRARARPLAAALTLVALVAVQRHGELGHLHLSFARQHWAPRVPLLERLPADEEPYRIAAVGAALLPNSAALWGLEDIRGDAALTLRRLVETRRLLGADGNFSRLLLDSLDSRFLDFLNVRFALAPAGGELPAGWQEVAREGRTRLVENRRVLARAHLPPTVRIGSDPVRLGAELAAATRFGQRAWIEPWAPGARREPRTAGNGRGELRIRREGLGYHLTARISAPSWITVSVPAWRGWRAVSGGRELPLAFANHAYLGIQVPAGDSEIALRYRPRSFEIGLALSAASLATLVALLAWGAMRRSAAQAG